MPKTWDLQKLYKEFVAPQLKAHYKQYKQYYKSISMDEKDITQEMYVLMLELIQKYTEVNDEDFEKLLVTSTHYKLCNLVDSAITTRLKLSSEDTIEELGKLLHDKKIDAETYRVGRTLLVRGWPRADILKKYNLSKKKFRNIVRELRTNFAVKHNSMRIIRFMDAQGRFGSELDLDMPKEGIFEELYSHKPNCIDNIQVEDMMGIIKERLSPRHYDIFCAKVLDGKSNDEIKIQFRVSRQYVRQIIKRVQEIFSKKEFTK